MQIDEGLGTGKGTLFSKFAQSVWYFTRENKIPVVQIAQRLRKRSGMLFSEFVGRGDGLLAGFVRIWVEERVKDAVSLTKTRV